MPIPRTLIEEEWQCNCKYSHNFLDKKLKFVFPILSQTSQVIKACRTEITSALRAATTEKKLKPYQRVTAKGLLSQLEDPTNKFLLEFLFDVLNLLEKITLSFQSTKSTISTSLEILAEVRKQLAERKDIYTTDYISNLTEVTESESLHSSGPRPKRLRTLPAHFSDSVVTASVPIFHKPSNAEEMRAHAVDVLNSFEQELERRFSDENTNLWGSLKNLLPSSENFLDPNRLKPLLEYVLTIPWFDYLLMKNGTIDEVFSLLKSECIVFKDMLKRRFTRSEAERKKEGLGDGDIISRMFLFCQNEESMPVISALLRTAVVTGYSTFTVENSFSARNRVDTDRRRSLSPYKQGNLSLLHFEKELLNNISFEDFLSEWRKKPRRLNV